MEKISKLLPLALLSVFIGKLVILGVDAPSAGVIFALTGYVALKDYLDKHKKIQEISDIVNKQNEIIAKMATEIDALKTSMVGVKMGQNFKKVI